MTQNGNSNSLQRDTPKEWYYFNLKREKQIQKLKALGMRTINPGIISWVEALPRGDIILRNRKRSQGK